jgi:hypothetical protein
MDASRWERVAAATGIVFIALLALGNFLAPNPPAQDDPIQEVIDFAVDNRSALLIGSYLTGLALVFGLWFLGSLRSFLMRAEGGTGRLSGVAFAGGIVFAGLVFVSNAVGNGITLRIAEEGDPVAVRALFDTLTVLIASASFPVAVLVAATSIVAMRTGVLPRWYGQAGPVVTLVFLVAGTAVYLDHGFLAPGGGFTLIAFVVFALWVLVTSVLMMQRLGGQGTRAETASRLAPD